MQKKSSFAPQGGKEIGGNHSKIPFLKFKFGLVWYGLVCFCMILYGMVRGYCPDLLPCKISSF